MENTSVLQLFAIDKHLQIKSINDVERGLACGCSCPSCGEALIARQGDVREWHFAHTSGNDCVNGAETALHLAAKQIIMQSQGITIPERVHSETVRLKDGRVGEGVATRPEMWLSFSQVETEITFGRIRPDVVASLGTTYFFIEIAVTHFIEEDKFIFLKNELKIPTIEINLAGMHHQSWTWDSLEEAVLMNVAQKEWIKILDDTSLILEARELALQHALSVEIPAAKKNTAIEPKRTRFFINERMLDVIERPFGIAIWSPYDPYLNALLKQLMRLVGGRWQPQFKNWLVPLEAKDFLYEAITEMANKPPK
ncbi:MAG: hypothetical protein CTY33_02970 [Methylotenera sp.]|nr:MAG: hypothetical protein CTY33_02970 [Methylotenera sp.]